MHNWGKMILLYLKRVAALFGLLYLWAFLPALAGSVVIRQAGTLAELSEWQLNAIQQQLMSNNYDVLLVFNGTRDNCYLYVYHLLPVSHAALHPVQKSDQAGKTGLNNVIVGQEQLQQIRQGYAHSVLDEHKAGSALEKAVSRRLDFNHEMKN